MRGGRESEEEDDEDEGGAAGLSDREARERRQAIRGMPEVKRLVQTLWDTAATGLFRLHKEDYLDYHLSAWFAVQRIQAGSDGAEDEEPSAEDYADAWETAHDDWASDVDGMPSLHFDGFFDSVSVGALATLAPLPALTSPLTPPPSPLLQVVELADVSTDGSLEASEIVLFLKQLVLHATAAPAGRDGKRGWA